MGQHDDGDSQDLFARITHYLRTDLQVGLDYDFMERGMTLSETQETVSEIGADVTYNLTDNISIVTRYGFETVNNFDLEPGVNRQNHLFMTSVKFQF